MLQASHRNYKV